MSLPSFGDGGGEGQASSLYDTLTPMLVSSSSSSSSYSPSSSESYGSGLGKRSWSLRGFAEGWSQPVGSGTVGTLQSSSEAVVISNNCSATKLCIAADGGLHCAIALAVTCLPNGAFLYGWSRNKSLTGRRSFRSGRGLSRWCRSSAWVCKLNRRDGGVDAM